MGGTRLVSFSRSFFLKTFFPFDLNFKLLCNTLKIFISATPTSLITASVSILSLLFTTEIPFWSTTLANESGECVNILVVKKFSSERLVCIFRVTCITTCRYVLLYCLQTFTFPLQFIIWLLRLNKIWNKNGFSVVLFTQIKLRSWSEFNFYMFLRMERIVSLFVGPQ